MTDLNEIKRYKTPLAEFKKILKKAKGKITHTEKTIIGRSFVPPVSRRGRPQKESVT